RFPETAAEGHAGAVHDPAQNAGALFGGEDVGQAFDALLRGDSPPEGDQPKSSPEAFAACVYPRLVVGHEPELMGGGEGEVLVVEETCGDLVPAGQQFDLGFIESG